jgi:flagellar export protein FliJ
MAKGDLHAIIRINKMEIDEARRRIGDLQRREDTLIARDRALDAQLEAETAAANAHPEAAFTLANFLTVHRRRKEEVAHATAEVRAELEREREALAGLFRRRKTYELAQEARDRRAAADIARKDQAVLDEIGLTMTRRRRAESEEDDGADGAR